MGTISLSEISIYPVKSFAGVYLNSVQLDRFGPGGDRRWMLVDDENIAITQRDIPQLALTRVELHAGGLGLRLGEACIEVATPDASAKKCSVRVWSDQVDAVDAGNVVAAWLTVQLGISCRLVYIPEDSVRLVDSQYAKMGETVSFADAFPLLLISQASLDDLTTRLEKPVPMNRFRPNLVVSGCEPFAEDKWKRIRIGEVEFDVAKPCDRCVMPSIDQENGQKDKSINRVLASFRRRDGKIYFGQNLLYQGTGLLRISSQVEVIE